MTPDGAMPYQSTRSGTSPGAGAAWLHPWSRRADGRANLFCFGYAGGSASMFRPWPVGLPAGLNLWAAQLPGRGNRLHEAPIASIPILVDGLVAALRPHLGQPFAFFGHSMGAVLAFEVARYLAENEGALPFHLFVSARRPPRVAGLDSALRTLPDHEFVQEIDRRYGGMPAAIRQSPDVLALLLPALRADIVALETFLPTPRAPLSCPISAFGGLQDRLAPRDHLEAWRAETEGPFRIRWFAGGHFYLDARRDEVLADLSVTLAPMLRLAERRVR